MSDDFAVDFDDEQNLKDMASLIRSMGYVHKSELRELVEKFRDSDYAHSHDYYAQIGLCIAADELEELL